MEAHPTIVQVATLCSQNIPPHINHLLHHSGMLLGEILGFRMVCNRYNQIVMPGDGLYIPEADVLVIVIQ